MLLLIRYDNIYCSESTTLTEGENTYFNWEIVQNVSIKSDGFVPFFNIYMCIYKLTFAVFLFGHMVYQLDNEHDIIYIFLNIAQTYHILIMHCLSYLSSLRTDIIFPRFISSPCMLRSELWSQKTILWIMCTGRICYLTALQITQYKKQTTCGYQYPIYIKFLLYSS